MTPGPLRADEMANPEQSLRWHNALRMATADLERRPRMMLWSAGPLSERGGTIAIDRPPFKVGAVILASLQVLSGDLPEIYAPLASFRRLTDGRVLVTYSVFLTDVGAPFDCKFQLAFLLIEAPA